MSILAFKAGRLQRRENTNWLDPALTKGALQLLVADDGLLHFQWRNRVTNTIEDDLIIFPSEASFEKVSQAAGGRTYVLKFTSSNQRHFYWLQDASTERDSQNIENVNGLLQDPTYAPRWEDASSQDAPQASTSSCVEGCPHDTTTTHQTKLMESSNIQPPTAHQLSELRNILSQISQDPGASGPHAPELLLSDILTPANLAPLFESPELVHSIFPHLPADLPIPPSSEALQNIIDSPQFHAAVRSLDQALSTGLLGGLVRGLGLPEAAGTGVGPFLEAIKEQAQRHGSSDQDTMEID
ncbi:adhesion regulating molecule [Gautieria morchelliformis]|nr:adhesion regulating molecule [Gautieria morchelliformis]